MFKMAGKRKRLLTLLFTTCFLFVCFIQTNALYACKGNESKTDGQQRWRGFNLIEKFSKDFGNQPFLEKDFKLISELGFNFVRIPLDYRLYIKDNDWNKFDEKVFKEIDNAVAWGRKYKIHVCINIHRVPGFCVNPPEEPLNLWTSEEAQKVCALHWAKFAKRYKGIPSKDLSFNLFNEPIGVDTETYVKVVKKMTDTIRAIDPDRIIIADSMEWAIKPVEELIPLNIMQSFHWYQPMTLTHYKADWVDGSDTWPVPTFPCLVLNPYLYGDLQAPMNTPMVLEGGFKEQSKLRIKVDTVSDYGLLKVKADGITVFEKEFVCGEGEGEWKESVYKPEYGIYQNIYDKDYTAIIPANTQKVEIVVEKGDWISFSEMGIQKVQPSDSTEVVLRPTSLNWGEPNGTVYFDDAGNIDFNKSYTSKTQTENLLSPWKEISSKGVKVLVGEFGVYNKTPHDVTLQWMEENLKLWKDNGWGWSLWNFKGEFGIFNSERSDVNYENYKGYKLDRKMLELLQKY